MKNIENVPNTRIMTEINRLLPVGVAFKPKIELYDYLGIGRKRFAQITKGEKSPTLKELEAISNHFGISLQLIIKN
jgi:transcriptional regulator with XRE-family HTH domain